MVTGRGPFPPAFRHGPPAASRRFRNWRCSAPDGGVQVFFVISGFVIAFSAENSTALRFFGKGEAAGAGSLDLRAGHRGGAAPRRAQLADGCRDPARSHGIVRSLLVLGRQRLWDARHRDRLLRRRLDLAVAGPLPSDGGGGHRDRHGQHALLVPVLSARLVGVCRDALVSPAVGASRMLLCDGRDDLADAIQGGDAVPSCPLRAVFWPAASCRSPVRSMFTR